ncbi:MAG: antibiotic biosynthesis monooxygenase [Pseudomonadota bacterium]
MISLTALIRVKKGSEEAMRLALTEVVDYVKTHEPGTIGYFLSQGVDDPCEFTTYERYVDQTALNLHNDSKKIADFFEIAKPILDGEVVVEICEEIANK